ncbi:MAG TPA: glycosyltransferase [Stellaceae bacterium]|nr:glycosyltransferase [Stellaceae bacterium]
MTRLLQAMAGAEHGGAEIFFVRLATALQRAGQDQRVLIRRNMARAVALRSGGIEPIELPFRSWFDLKTPLGYRRAIRQYRPEVVLTWMSRATELCPRGKFVHVARLGGYYDLKYYRNCDHLIGNTRHIVEYLVHKGWSKRRVHYIPNFVPSMSAAAARRSSFDTPDDTVLALALGRLHPNKGFDLLLDALALTRGIHLWIAGDGPLKEELERQARGLRIADRVRFLGWRDDTAMLLAASDMLVSSSKHEPLGNVVLEAWAAGVPVVATASVGPRALIRDGETGLLVPLGDAAALATAMTRLAEDIDLRMELAAAGRAAHAAEFSEEVVVAQYRAFFDEVAR